MPRVTGFLRVMGRRGLHPDQGLPGEGEGPVDPGYGVDEGASPDNGLPPLGSGVGPDNGLPTPPPGIWPPLTPTHPIQPAPPGTPPGSIWPPVGGRPVRPDQGLPGSPPAPDQGLPGGADGLHPDQGLPGPKVYWVVAGIPGVGWRYVAVDPNARPVHPIEPPPTPQPK